MADDVTGPDSGSPPSFPGSAPPPPAAPPPAAPPQAPPPPPPSYPQSSPFPSPSGFNSPTGVVYASWGTRLGGYLIDFAIFLVPLIVLFLLFRHAHTLQVHFMMRSGHRARRFSLLSFVIVAVLALLYSTFLCGGKRGQTVGMMAVHVRVVRDGSYDELGYGRAFVRSIVEQLFRAIGALVALGFIVWAVDMLFPLWDKKNQTLHDKVVSTVVIPTQN
jgi:uncharacterized RDD family membrane protein YckC